RGFISKHRGSKTYLTKIDTIINHILKGLIEIHDRGLLHGDIKPSNILINYSPLKAVIGDCGFVSSTRYAKITCTAPRYREKEVQYDYGHDMYSFGITLFEIFSNTKLNEQFGYRQIEGIIEREIVD